MGCFSYICKVSGEAVLSSSFDGDDVHLFLLKDGEVIEYMHGNYNSYGQVFDGEGDSFEWGMDWGDVCNLCFGADTSSGIAAVLGPYYNGTPPTTRSEQDPNQGWGEHGELMGSTSEEIGSKVENPFHFISVE